MRYTFREAGLSPGREWLDSVMPDRPVALLDRMWGTMMVNSKALQLAGIDRNTADPRNGYLERDELSGEPNGLLIDGAYALIHTEGMPVGDAEETLVVVLQLRPALQHTMVVPEV